MMKLLVNCITVLLLILFLTLFSLPVCHAKSRFEDLDSKWNRLEQKMQEKLDNRQSDMDEQWIQAQQEFQTKWDQKNAQILQKWDTAVRSTRKDWVSYLPDLGARSRVDFENGRMVFEVVIPESVKDPIRQAKKKIKELGLNVLAQKDETGTPILDRQIKTRKGQSVDESNKNKFMEQEVMPRVMPSPQVFTAQDGVMRRKYEFRIDLVPSHLRIRAEKYLPLVTEYAGRNGLQPQLVLAVIHTESYFNPRAVSSCQAIGLMQIIPRFAGRDANRYLFAEDVIKDHAYYFDPENNIQAGCTYLFLLKTKYFKNITDTQKNLFVTVCGYNWGPTAMVKNITDLYRVNEMSDKKVYDLLQQKTPEETRNYVKQVITRMSIYELYFLD